MSNNRAKLVTVLKKTELESAIANYKVLSEQIKTLEAKRDLLKESLVKSYFAKNEAYFNTDGVCLATYKMQTRFNFQTTDFKETHPAFYDSFLKPQDIFVLLIKK